ncbi:MAG: N-acetyl-gamma-glutamyl-phosphate reductase [Treponema sp.]|jgi:N-acetyl-gamma-glutamyl-phosphate reductase|nr:N-acetyl-gamma-glutamyl-phosphate reductase [Treponema sp.]
MMIAGVIGAAGYAGAELVRLLAGHPEVSALVLGSVSLEGGRIEEVYPNLLGRVSAALEKPEAVIARADVVFGALPAGLGEGYAAASLERGVSYIDLSADFRFDDDEPTYTAWYGKPYKRPELRRRSVYGLPELNRARIKALAAQGACIVGNPGCYPTGASLGAYPALARGLSGAGVREGTGGVIIVDSASGVTGGGREPQRSFHFSECFDSLAPYKVGSHRHSPEIARNLAKMAGRPVPLIFTPHLAPMNRGIQSTIYIPLTAGWDAAAPRPPGAEIVAKTAGIRELYADFYRDEPFVRVLPEGAVASTGRVRHSNFCDISVHLDPAGSTLIVASAIDNMVKGAAGQAIQNMNLLLGYAETAGLMAIPASF